MILKRLSRRASVPVISLLSLLFASSVQAEYRLNLTKGVTPVSHQIYSLHMTVFWICVGIGVIVFGTMAYSIFNHRKSKGAVAASFHESTVVEIFWTLIPLGVLIAIAIPATATLLNLENSDKADVNIEVTGIQWKWKYKYIDEGIEFISSLSDASRNAEKDPTGVKNYLLDVDNPIVVPVHKKIRFLMTSQDVIHSWFVPALAVKQDAIPGFINDSWAKIEKPGTYRGQCAELCGQGHGFMPIVVKAVSEADYKKWVVAQKDKAAAVAASSGKEWSRADLMAKGKEVYGKICAGCHQPTGLGLPGVFPALAGSKTVTGDINGHIDTVMNGRTGTAMSAFKNQLSDVDIAAVITYERNSFGNTMGDMVQPSTIKNLR